MPAVQLQCVYIYIYIYADIILYAYIIWYVRYVCVYIYNILINIAYPLLDYHVYSTCLSL